MRMDSRQIVKRALISEKGSILRERANQFTFEVHTDANKIEIKRAVESIFKVKVERPYPDDARQGQAPRALHGPPSRLEAGGCDPGQGPDDRAVRPGLGLTPREEFEPCL